MYNRKTLIKALAVIKEVCKEFNACHYCPMYSDNYETCFMDIENPDLWVLATDTTSQRVIRED